MSCSIAMSASQSWWNAADRRKSSHIIVRLWESGGGHFDGAHDEEPENEIDVYCKGTERSTSRCRQQLSLDWVSMERCFIAGCVADKNMFRTCSFFLHKIPIKYSPSFGSSKIPRVRNSEVNVPCRSGADPGGRCLAWRPGIGLDHSWRD